MNKELQDQIEIKKFLKLRKIKMIKGKRNVDTLMLTLQPVFPSISLHPSNSSNTLIGKIRLSLVTEYKTKKYINVGVSISSYTYLGRVPVENDEIDFIDLELEIKKAENYIEKIELARNLIRNFKTELVKMIREDVISLKKKNIEVEFSSKCKILTAKTVDDVHTTLKIQGHITKEQIEKLLRALA